MLSKVARKLRRRGTLVVYPAYVLNPYIEMLNAGVEGDGWTLMALRRRKEWLSAVGELGSGDVVHLHWTQPICQTAESVDEASRRLDEALGVLDAARHRGARLVWTIHNRLPHELTYPDHERRLLRHLAATADAVHVLSEPTAQAMAGICSWPPERTVVIHHASFLGVYPQTLDRTTARARMDISDDDPVVLFLGQIRDYKGIEALVDAAGRAAVTSPRLTLLIAGKTSPALRDTIAEAIPDNVRVHHHLAFLEPERVQEWFAAADVTALPFREVLNSSSLLLSATFGVPVLLPAFPHLRAMWGAQPWVTFFDPDDDATDLAASLAATTPLDPAVSESARDFAESYRPADMAQDYVQMLRTLVDGRPSVRHPIP